jgi:hypothetical protein
LEFQVPEFEMHFVDVWNGRCPAMSGKHFIGWRVHPPATMPKKRLWVAHLRSYPG